VTQMAPRIFRAGVQSRAREDGWFAIASREEEEEDMEVCMYINLYR